MSKPHKTKMGRPEIPATDWEKFERLCALPRIIDNQDIAWIMGIDVSSCENYIKNKYGQNLTFSEFREQKGCLLKVKLLTRQIDVACDLKKPSVPMLIFLGKQYLGQADKTHIDTTSNEKGDDESLNKLVEAISSLAGRD